MELFIKKSEKFGKTRVVDAYFDKDPDHKKVTTPIFSFYILNGDWTLREASVNPFVGHDDETVRMMEEELDEFSFGQ
jgi:N-acetylneuraminic acid mutarotase